MAPWFGWGVRSGEPLQGAPAPYFLALDIPAASGTGSARQVLRDAQAPPVAAERRLAAVRSVADGLDQRSAALRPT